MRVEGIEDDFPGIRRISASYLRQRMEVDYDEKLITEEQIVAAVERLGYHVEMN
jgi:copper chaperone CopZ